MTQLVRKLVKSLSCITFAAVCLVFFGAGFAATAAQAEQVSFESFNKPGFFIRHAGFKGFITELKKPVDFEDSKFNIRPGLNGNPGTVSIESVNYPGFFLRHINFEIKLMQDDGSALFHDDATFRRVAGLAEPNAVSFTPDNAKFQYHWIRHTNYELWLATNDGLLRLSKEGVLALR